MLFPSDLDGAEIMCFASFDIECCGAEQEIASDPVKFRLPEARAGRRHLGYCWLQSVHAGIGFAGQFADAGEKAHMKARHLNVIGQVGCQRLLDHAHARPSLLFALMRRNVRHLQGGIGDPARVPVMRHLQHRPNLFSSCVGIAAKAVKDDRIPKGVHNAGGVGEFAGKGNGFFRPGQRPVRKAEHPQAYALVGSGTHRSVVTAVHEGVRKVFGPIERETLCRVFAY